MFERFTGAAGARAIDGDAVLLGLLREAGVRPLVVQLGGNPQTLEAGAAARLRSAA